MDSKFRDLVLEIQKLKQCNKSTKHIEIQIDEMIFDLYEKIQVPVEVEPVDINIFENLIIDAIKKAINAPQKAK